MKKRRHGGEGEESTIFLVAIKRLSESSKKTKIYDGNVILFCPTDSNRKSSVMGKMRREWQSLLSGLINRNIAYILNSSN